MQRIERLTKFRSGDRIDFHLQVTYAVTVGGWADAIHDLARRRTVLRLTDIPDNAGLAQLNGVRASLDMLVTARRGRRPDDAPPPVSLERGDSRGGRRQAPAVAGPPARQPDQRLQPVRLRLDRVGEEGR
ncbi:hypothetical protein [Streptomyces sp. NPDC001292]|uniref:hypothetical protein n=1 Tax=Streptomyces sp. NPDC001292 TaxID=3364558 RepID=UPI0036A44421